MPRPVLPEEALAPLKAVQEFGFRHEVQFETLEVVRLPNGEYDQRWAEDGGPEPGLLIIGGAGLAELAAARGVRAEGVLKVRRGRLVAGRRALVRGVLGGVAWQRLMRVTADLGGNTERMVRRALVVDEELTE